MEDTFDGAEGVVEEPKEGLAPEADPEVDAGAEPEVDEEAKRKEEEEHKRKTGSQRAREKAARLEAENQALRDALAKGGKREEPEPKQVDDGRPKPPRLEDFDRLEDYESARDEYTEALAEYKLNQREAERHAQERANLFQQKMAAAASLHEDFQEALEEFQDSEIPFTHAMEVAVLASEDGAELLHKLVKNPEKAARIAAMHPMGQAFEMGRLLASSAQSPKTEPKPEPKTTQAPPPPKPVKKPGAATVDPSKVSDADFWKDVKKGK